MAAGEGGHRLHVADLAVQVDRDDRPRSARQAASAADPTSIRPVSRPRRRKAGDRACVGDASAVAMYVCAGTMTSSPSPTPAARRAIVRAAVPDVTATQWRTPQYAANSASNRSTSSPRTNVPCSSTESNATRSSSAIGAWCRRMSTKGIRGAAGGAPPLRANRLGPDECAIAAPGCRRSISRAKGLRAKDPCFALGCHRRMNGSARAVLAADRRSHREGWAEAASAGGRDSRCQGRRRAVRDQLPAERPPTAVVEAVHGAFGLPEPRRDLPW